MWGDACSQLALQDCCWRSALIARRPRAQIIRLNTMDAELSRKKAAGEKIPTLLAEDAAKGEFKLPYTNIK